LRGDFPLRAWDTQYTILSFVSQPDGERVDNSSDSGVFPHAIYHGKIEKSTKSILPQCAKIPHLKASIKNATV
jgi:hypothetical protein